MGGGNHEFLKNGREIFFAEGLDMLLIKRSDLPDAAGSAKPFVIASDLSAVARKSEGGSNPSRRKGRDGLLRSFAPRNDDGERLR